MNKRDIGLIASSLLTLGTVYLGYLNLNREPSQYEYNPQHIQQIESTPTPKASASSTPRPTSIPLNEFAQTHPTSTPEPTSDPVLSHLSPEQQEEYKVLTQEQQDGVRTMISHDYNITRDVDLAAIASMGHYFNQHPTIDTKAILDSPIGPDGLKGSEVYNFGLFDTGNGVLMTEYAMQQAGFDVHTYKHGEFPALDPDQYTLTALLNSRHSEIAGGSASDFTQFTDFTATMDEIIKHHPSDKAFITTLTGHTEINMTPSEFSRIGSAKMALTSWYDLASVDDIIPETLLDKLEAPYIAIIDNCPKSWPDEMERYIQNHNEQRIEEGREPLDYLLVFPDPGNDPDRLVPLGHMMDALEVSVQSYIRHDATYRARPLTTLGRWDDVLGGGLEMEGLKTSMEGNYLQYILPGIYGEEFINRSIYSYFLIRSDNPNAKEDNTAIQGLEIRTNIESSRYTPIINIE